MRSKFLLGAMVLMSALIMIAGCERKVVVESKESAELGSCFTCHGDNGLLLQAQGEWKNSIHASGNNIDYTNRGGGSDCTKCHDHQGFLEYLATGSVSAPYSSVSAIHCFTCHAPHERGNLTLRTVAPVALKNGEIFDHGNANLCVNCHQARESVGQIVDSLVLTSNRWGPHHSQQGDMLNGSNCFEIDGYDYDKTSHHANLIDDACAGCHMGSSQAHDGYRIGGHSFNMLYVSEETGDTSNLASGVCGKAGCHPGATNYDIDSAQTHVHEWLEELHTLLVDAGVLNATTGLPNVPRGGTLLIPDKNVAGALWNYLQIEGDRSFGVHNFALIRDLLQSSIDYLESLQGSPVVKPRVLTAPIASH